MQATATRPKTQATMKRTMRWLRHDGPGKGVLAITMKAGTSRPEVFRYRVEPIEGADFGPAYAMGKVSEQGIIVEVYNLNLAGGGSCECMGHYRHGRCKHLDAIRQLTAIGKI